LCPVGSRGRGKPTHGRSLRYGKICVEKARLALVLIVAYPLRGKMNEVIELFMKGMLSYLILFGFFILLWAIVKGSERARRTNAERPSWSFALAIGIFFFGFLCGISWLIGIIEKMANSPSNT